MLYVQYTSLQLTLLHTLQPVLNRNRSRQVRETHGHYSEPILWSGQGQSERGDILFLDLWLEDWTSDIQDLRQRDSPVKWKVDTLMGSHGDKGMDICKSYKMVHPNNTSNSVIIYIYRAITKIRHHSQPIYNPVGVVNRTRIKTTIDHLWAKNPTLTMNST